MVTKKLFREGPYADFFSQGVLAGNVLTLAGQIATEENGNVPDNIIDQMISCYKNIQHILGQFDASLDNVIDETWFVTDVQEVMDNVSDLFSERERIYGCKPEVSQTLVGTSGLVSPDLKIEIKCIAYLD